MVAERRSSLFINDNWKDTQQAGIQATRGLRRPNDLESAIRIALQPGNYTAVLSGKNNTTGVGLVEVYDIEKSVSSALTNVSTRGFVGTDQNVMVGGFITEGGNGTGGAKRPGGGDSCNSHCRTLHRYSFGQRWWNGDKSG